MRLPLPYHIEKLVYEFIGLKEELIAVRKKLTKPNWIVMYADICPWMYLRVHNTSQGSGPLYEIQSELS